MWPHSFTWRFNTGPQTFFLIYYFQMNLTPLMNHVKDPLSDPFLPWGWAAWPEQTPHRVNEFISLTSWLAHHTCIVTDAELLKVCPPSLERIFLKGINCLLCYRKYSALHRRCGRNSVTQHPLVVTKQYRNFRLKGPIIPVFKRGPPGKSYLALCLQHPAEADASVWNTDTSRTKRKHFSTGGKSALCAHLFVFFVFFLPHLFSIYCSVKLLEKVSRLRSSYIWDLELTLINPNILGGKLGRELL